MRIPVIVDWFDVLKGVGIGKTTRGKEVFLSSEKIVIVDNNFTPLLKSEILDCEVKEVGGYLVAEKIERIN